MKKWARTAIDSAARAAANVRGPMVGLVRRVKRCVTTQLSPFAGVEASSQAGDRWWPFSLLITVCYDET